MLFFSGSSVNPYPCDLIGKSDTDDYVDNHEANMLRGSVILTVNLIDNSKEIFE